MEVLLKFNSHKVQNELQFQLKSPRFAEMETYFTFRNYTRGKDRGGGEGRVGVKEIPSNSPPC